MNLEKWTGGRLALKRMGDIIPKLRIRNVKQLHGRPGLMKKLILNR